MRQACVSLLQRLLVCASATAGAATLGCSAVGHVYLQPGYAKLTHAQAPQNKDARASMPQDPNAETAITRLGVVTWAWPQDRGLGEVLGTVASDLIKLHKNYLVYDPMVAQRAWTEGCRDQVTGVALLRVLDRRQEGNKVRLHLALEVLRCADGALVWRAEAEGSHASTDPSLSELTAHYTSLLGPAAVPYTAPTFTLLQELVEALPEPQLSDAEVTEKIEMG